MCRIGLRSGNCKKDIKRRSSKEMNDNNSLAHTTWNCKYHIVFAPKYRRRIFYDEYKREIGKILRELCEWKKIAEYIRDQLKEDQIHDQMTLREFEDPFTGSR